MINIQVSGIKEAKARFSDTKPKTILTSSLKRLVEYCENRVGLNARNLVYSYVPKTKGYKRTGNLLGGRGNGLSGGKPATTQLNPLSYKVEANPQLKGASFNYAPYVNSGKGWMKKVGPRPFWTRSVEETKREAPRILKELTVKEYGN